MPEKIFDPTIHQDLDHLEGFKFRNNVLVDGIDSYKKANEKYRDASCTVIAQEIGLAESTLKKLKQGQISDPRGSTYWLIWKATGIDVRKLMGIPTNDSHASESYNAATQALLDEKDKRIAELERGLIKRESVIRHRNRLLALLVFVLLGLFVADLLVSSSGWLRFNLL